MANGIGGVEIMIEIVPAALHAAVASLPRRAFLIILFPPVDAAKPLRAAVVVARFMRGHIFCQHGAIAADLAVVDVGPCTLIAIIGRV